MTKPIQLIIIITISLSSFLACNSANSIEVASKTIPGSDSSPMSIVSARWKKERKIEDFHYLKDNYLKVGIEATEVIKILGEPLNKSKHNSTRYWLYIKCNVTTKQYYAWTCVIGKDNKISQWIKKGIA